MTAECQDIRERIGCPCIKQAKQGVNVNQGEGQEPEGATARTAHKGGKDP